MAWQLYVVVFFSSCGSLLSLVESTVYKRGVQHDVPVSSLVAAGCVSCYEKPYGSVSKSKDIGYPASALFSEERHHGIKERGIVREGVRDGRTSIDLSRSDQLAKDILVDTNVTVGALQVNVCT